MTHAIKKEIGINLSSDDSNYPDSELTLEQEADSFIDNYLKVINGTAKLIPADIAHAKLKKYINELKQNYE